MKTTTGRGGSFGFGSAGFIVSAGQVFSVDRKLAGVLTGMRFFRLTRVLGRETKRCRTQFRGRSSEFTSNFPESLLECESRSPPILLAETMKLPIVQNNPAAKAKKACARLEVLNGTAVPTKPVSYTHLTLPTIYSV